MNHFNDKLILGTVQFGLDYGINNKNGKPEQEAVVNILKEANRLNISTLDTADLYGDSADRIGAYLSAGGNEFKIISKFCRTDDRSIESYLQESLHRLKISSLEGYLFHRFDDFLKFDNFPEFIKLKEKKLVRKLGVSLYSNEQLKVAVENHYVDLIQLPFNLFDSSSEKIDLLEKAKAAGKEIHVRSVFFQGLFFIAPNELQGSLKDLSENLKDLQKIQKESGVEMKDFCLSYVDSFKCIDKIVVGVDTSDQLVKNFSYSRPPLRSDSIQKIKEINIKDKNLLDPSKWKIK